MAAHYLQRKDLMLIHVQQRQQQAAAHPPPPLLPPPTVDKASWWDKLQTAALGKCDKVARLSLSLSLWAGLWCNSLWCE